MVIERTILDGPRMRFLILAVAVAVTASPVGRVIPQLGRTLTVRAAGTGRPT